MVILTEEQKQNLEKAADVIGPDTIFKILEEKCLWVALDMTRYPRKMDRVHMSSQLASLLIVGIQASHLLGSEVIQTMLNDAVDHAAKMADKKLARRT